MIRSKIAVGLLSAVTLIGFGTAAFAKHTSYGGGNIGARQERQALRIERGIDNGQLTRYEVRKLRAEQRDIDLLKRCLKQAGGRGLQPMERRVLQRLLNLASDNIRELKHNDQRSRKFHRRYSENDDYTPRRRAKFTWLKRWYR